MNFPHIVIHTEVSFDSVGIEPCPFWIPFFWVKRFKYNPEELSTPGFVIRAGLLGIHVCLAAHYYPLENGPERRLEK